MKTIEDIARLAGVAKSTVSRYFNGWSINDSTKRKIERFINETGYMPNSFAQSLKAKKPNIIGAIVPRLDSFAAPQILMGIDKQLREQNYHMLISNTSQVLEHEIESIYSLCNQKVAGIILLATQITNAHMEAFSEKNYLLFWLVNNMTKCIVLSITIVPQALIWRKICWEMDIGKLPIWALPKKILLLE